MAQSSHRSNASSPSYEECHRKSLEENRKRTEALNLPQLTQSLRKSASPPPLGSQMKYVQNQRSMKRLEKAVNVLGRRSSRAANMPAATSYREEVVVRVVDTEEGMSHLVCVSKESREYALEKAEGLGSTLEPHCSTLMRSMLLSHVSSCFWLGLPVKLCQMHLPKADTVINLIYEEGEGSPVIYLARKTGICSGWRGFSISHDLADGDAVIFQLSQPQ